MTDCWVFKTHPFLRPWKLLKPKISPNKHVHHSAPDFHNNGPGPGNHHKWCSQRPSPNRANRLPPHPLKGAWRIFVSGQNGRKVCINMIVPSLAFPPVASQRCLNCFNTGASVDPWKSRSPIPWFLVTKKKPGHQKTCWLATNFDQKDSWVAKIFSGKIQNSHIIFVQDYHPVMLGICV